MLTSNKKSSLDVEQKFIGRRHIHIPVFRLDGFSKLREGKTGWNGLRGEKIVAMRTENVCLEVWKE